MDGQPPNHNDRESGPLSRISEFTRSPYRLVANERVAALKCHTPTVNGIAPPGDIGVSLTANAIDWKLNGVHSTI
jgi:hypothetical protein